MFSKKKDTQTLKGFNKSIQHCISNWLSVTEIDHSKIRKKELTGFPRGLVTENSRLQATGIPHQEDLNKRSIFYIEFVS